MPAVGSHHRKHAESTRRPTGEPAAAGPVSGAALYRDLITYYNFGDHRTATPGDTRTSDWLALQLRRAGFRTGFESFTLDQFFIQKTSLVINGVPIACFPLWPVRPAGLNQVNAGQPNGVNPTPPANQLAPIKARLGIYRRGGGNIPRDRIALIKFPFDPRSSVYKGSGHAELIEGAARAGARAIVGVTEGPTGELIALNPQSAQPPWPVPILLAPGRDEAMLTAAAQRGDEAQFLIDGREDRNASARNVIGRLDRGKEVIVISTPQSGWFRCAAERGPGIAIFLGLARWAAQQFSEMSFLFVSTSGHEIGELGMKRFIADQAPPPSRVRAWIHLGAGMAACKWESSSRGPRRTSEVDSNRFLMCSKDLAPVVTPIFAGLPGLDHPSSLPMGEFELIAKRGYKVLGIAASHQFHQTPSDSPEMTSPELLGPVGAALVNAVEALDDRATT